MHAEHRLGYTWRSAAPPASWLAEQRDHHEYQPCPRQTWYRRSLWCGCTNVSSLPCAAVWEVGRGTRALAGSVPRQKLDPPCPSEPALRQAALGQAPTPLATRPSGVPKSAGMCDFPTLSSGATLSTLNPARFFTDRLSMASATCRVAAGAEAAPKSRVDGEVCRTVDRRTG